jgi:SAM-dependent methyltransferase
MGGETEAERGWRHYQRALFDGVAQRYDASRPGYPPELVEFVAATAGLRPGLAVLEIGCGTGQLTELLTGRGWQVTAIDLGPAMIAAARRRLAGPDGSAEPVSAGAVSAEHGPVEPVAVEPVSAESVSAESVSAGAVAAESVSAGAVPAEPVPVEPVAVEPVSAGAVSVVPVPAEPGPVPVETVSFEAVSFEDFAAPAASADLIISGAAFHWIDPEVRFAKSARLLRSGGWLALLDTGERYDDPLGPALADLWVTHGDTGGAWVTHSPDREAFAAAGLFCTPAERTQVRCMTRPAADVIAVESTRATWLSWPEDRRAAFTADLRRLLGSAPEAGLTQTASVTMAQVADFAGPATPLATSGPSE